MSPLSELIRRADSPGPVHGRVRIDAGTSEAQAMVLFNPSCSRCRTVKVLLAGRGVRAHYVRYLETAPSRAELEAVLSKIGADDPRDMMRTGEDTYDQLGLADASRGELLDAMVAHPVLIQRPIVVMGQRAVVARPPERVLDLLDG